MNLQLVTLGGLRCLADGGEVASLSAQRQRFAVFLYLAIERDTTRDQVMATFWPDREPERARHALSQTLYDLRRALGEGCVKTQGEHLIVAADVTVDTELFESATQRGDLEQALPLYRGEFLGGEYLADTKPYEEWVDRTRVRLVRVHRTARRDFVNRCVSRSNLALAIKEARRWVELEPLEDEAHHRLIELLAENGQRAEALEQFDRYERSLEVENLKPLDDTIELVHRLREGQVKVVRKSLPTRIDQEESAEGALPVLRKRSEPTRRWFASLTFQWQPRKHSDGPKRKRLMIRFMIGAASVMLLLLGYLVQLPFGRESSPPKAIVLPTDSSALPQDITILPRPAIPPPPPIQIVVAPDTGSVRTVVTTPPPPPPEPVLLLAPPSSPALPGSLDAELSRAAGRLLIGVVLDTIKPASEIYVSDPSGSTPKRLLYSNRQYREAAWSPAGRVAFVSQQDANDEIYTMNADGTGISRLTTNRAPDNHPRWSPDGQRLVFSSARSAANPRDIKSTYTEIYTMNADGSDVRRLTSNTFGDVNPDWSPDSKQIVFASDRPTGRGLQTELYVMNADGSSVRQLTFDGKRSTEPVWAPDGKRIAFSNQDGIHVINSDGTGQLYLVRGHTPSWSLDGKYVAYSAAVGGGHTDLFIAKSDGTASVRITSAPGNKFVYGWRR